MLPLVVQSAAESNVVLTVVFALQGDAVRVRLHLYRKIYAVNGGHVVVVHTGIYLRVPRSHTQRVNRRKRQKADTHA